MPIYAYKCSACGYAHDTLQKMSDAPLTVCPQCNQSTYSKQVTAAGFQLKGSGWYVTDFRDKSSGGAKTSELPPSKTAQETSGGSEPAASAASTVSSPEKSASTSSDSSTTASASSAGSSTASTGTTN